MYFEGRIEQSRNIEFSILHNINYNSKVYLLNMRTDQSNYNNLIFVVTNNWQLIFL